jgi:hypothetical protein
MKPNPFPWRQGGDRLPLFEIALVLVRLDHVASFIEDAIPIQPALAKAMDIEFILSSHARFIGVTLVCSW